MKREGGINHLSRIVSDWQWQKPEENDHVQKNQNVPDEKYPDQHFHGGTASVEEAGAIEAIYAARGSCQQLGDLRCISFIANIIMRTMLMMLIWWFSRFSDALLNILNLS